jgi:hypothetical protein
LTQPPTVSTVEDTGLGHPYRVVSRVMGRDGPDEVVALHGRVLVPGAALETLP